MPTSKSHSTVTVIAVKRILRPLIGLLLDNGLNYSWLAKLLKELFVDVVRAESADDLSDSRISLITGVHRKDIKRFRESEIERDSVEVGKLLPARIIATWLADKRFSVEGKPNALPLTSDDSNVGFDQLVISCTTDIRPRAVLDEWLESGIVKTDTKGLIYLQENAYVPDASNEQKIIYLGRNVGDHLASARHNVSTDQALMLERSVYYDQLSAESVAKLEEKAKRLGMQMLQDLNAEAYELQQKDIKNNQPPISSREEENNGEAANDQRINFGLYFHRTQQDS
jgi:hypothetical protein